AGIGHPDMRGVAGDERAAVAELARDQAAAVPVFLRDDLVVEVGADAENGAQASIAVDRVEIALVRLHVVVHQPALASVDGVDHPGARRVDRAGTPGTLVPLQPDQCGCADVGRLHALDDGIAGQLRADCLAYNGAPAVATDQKAATDAPDMAALEIAQGDAG